MVRPIKETLILYGNDARIVLDRMKNGNTWSQEKIEDVWKVYEHFKDMQRKNVRKRFNFNYLIPFQIENNIKM
jgi:hypothetical protein